MARVNLLSAANIAALSIVDKGANRKRWFLRKAQGEPDVIGDLPGPGRIVKAADWSAVYCVVAEPGWQEDPGLGAPDQAIPDEWASEDEIRKACHGFLKNGGLVNKMHADLEPYGQLVENAIAPADFTIDGEIIRKGSWYVAIEPNAHGRAAIEDGTFAGVSVQGSALRTLVDKATGKAPDPYGDTLAARMRRGLRKALGLKDDVTKASTFAGRMAEREFEDELPDAFSVLRDCVWSAFYPPADGTVDAKALVTTSLEEFQVWALELLDAVPVAKREDVAKALGVADPEAPGGKGATVENVTWTDEERAEFDAVKKSVEELPDTLTAKLGDTIGEAVAKATKPEPEAPTLEGVSEAVEKAAEEIAKVAADVKKLGGGKSSQTDPDPEPVVKNAGGASKGIV